MRNPSRLVHVTSIASNQAIGGTPGRHYARLAKRMARHSWERRFDWKTTGVATGSKNAQPGVAVPPKPEARRGAVLPIPLVGARDVAPTGEAAIYRAIIGRR